MLTLFAIRSFRHLFLAQVVALVGTGMATVALGLLAWQLVGDRAGTVMGTALAIKMVAYVAFSPVASALADRLPRRAFLVGLDLIRAGVIAFLPFATEVWQVYLLIFVLQMASAGFTPAFQSTLPDILTDERAYARGLSLMRLAEDMEQVASPLLAAVFLTVVSFPVLFGGTVLGFLASAALVGTVVLPPRLIVREPFADSLTKGLWVYLATPRLRGLFLMEGAVAAAGAMVYVNTVVLVQARLVLSEGFVALAFAAFGAGSMAAALLLPRVLDRAGDRGPMLAGAGLMLAGVALVPLAASFTALAAIWALIGAGFAASQVPVGRIVARSAREEDRGAVFAAQFALSHACWLVAYPVAGWLGAAAGMNMTALVLAGLGMLALIAGLRLWPSLDPAELLHHHPELPPDHPHLADGSTPHRHAFVIDPLHRRWPKPA